MPKISESRASLTQDDIDDIIERYADYYYDLQKVNKIIDHLIQKYKLTHQQIKRIACRSVPLMKRHGHE